MKKLIHESSKRIRSLKNSDQFESSKKNNSFCFDLIRSLIITHTTFPKNLLLTYIGLYRNKSKPQLSFLSLPHLNFSQYSFSPQLPNLESQFCFNVGIKKKRHKHWGSLYVLDSTFVRSFTPHNRK